MWNDPIRCVRYDRDVDPICMVMIEHWIFGFLHPQRGFTVNNATPEYDGSKSLIIRDSMLKTPEAVDKALDRLELRFGYLQNRRISLETSFNATDGLEAKGKIMDEDEGIA